MKKNLILLLIALVFGGGFWLYHNMEYSKFPTRISTLERTLRSENEKLISAEILDQEMKLVSEMIEKNLAISAQDSLAEDASMPFLNYVTEVLQELGIKLITLEPKKRRSQVDYIKTPYAMAVECSYEKFGQLVTRLEKSERLITVESFTVDNGFRKASAIGQDKDRAQEDRLFEMEISTLTLIKRQ
jgi:Tfp pilus assembly protein PilO